MNRAEKRTAAAQKKCDEWNATVPVGTAVDVRHDDGSITRTRTRSQAWVICDHASVLLDGISGGYLLERVTVRAGEV